MKVNFIKLAIITILCIWIALDSGSAIAFDQAAFEAAEAAIVAGAGLGSNWGGGGDSWSGGSGGGDYFAAATASIIANNGGMTTMGDSYGNAYFAAVSAQIIANVGGLTTTNFNPFSSMNTQSFTVGAGSVASFFNNPTFTMSANNFGVGQTNNGLSFNAFTNTMFASGTWQGGGSISFTANGQTSSFNIGSSVPVSVPLGTPVIVSMQADAGSTMGGNNYNSITIGNFGQITQSAGEIASHWQGTATEGGRMSMGGNEYMIPGGIGQSLYDQTAAAGMLDISQGAIISFDYSNGLITQLGVNGQEYDTSLMSPAVVNAQGTGVTDGYVTAPSMQSVQSQVPAAVPASGNTQTVDAAQLYLLGKAMDSVTDPAQRAELESLYNSIMQGDSTVSFQLPGSSALPGAISPYEIQPTSQGAMNSVNHPVGEQNGILQLMGFFGIPAHTAGAYAVASQSFHFIDATLHESRGWDPGQTVGIYHLDMSGLNPTFMGTMQANNAGVVDYVTNPMFLGHVAFSSLDGQTTTFSIAGNVPWGGDVLGARPSVNFDFGLGEMLASGYSPASYIAASAHDLETGVVRGIWSGDIPGSMYNYVTISAAGSWGPHADPLLICTQANVFSEDPVMSYMAMLAGSGLPGDYAMALLQNDFGNAHFAALNEFYAMNGQASLNPYEYGPAPWKTSCAEKLGEGFLGSQNIDEQDDAVSTTGAYPIGSGQTPGIMGSGAYSAGFSGAATQSGSLLGSSISMQSIAGLSQMIAAQSAPQPGDVNSFGHEYGLQNGIMQLTDFFQTPAYSGGAYNIVSQAFNFPDAVLNLSGGWAPFQSVAVYQIGTGGAVPMNVGTLTADAYGWVSYVSSPGFLGHHAFSSLDGQQTTYTIAGNVPWSGDPYGARPAVNFDFTYGSMAASGYNVASYVYSAAHDLATGVVRGIWSGDMPGTMYNYVTISGAGSWGPMSDPLLICSQANVFSDDPVMNYMAMLAGSGMPADYAFAILQNDPGNAHFSALNEFYAMNGQMSLNPYEYGPPPWQTSCAEKLGSGFFSSGQQEPADALALASLMNSQGYAMAATGGGQSYGSGVTPGLMGMGASSLGQNPGTQYSGPSINTVIQSAVQAIPVHDPEDVNSFGHQYGSQNGALQLMSFYQTPAHTTGAWNVVSQAFNLTDAVLNLSGGWAPYQSVSVYQIGTGGAVPMNVGTLTADANGWVSYVSSPGFLGHHAFSSLDGEQTTYTIAGNVPWSGDPYGARPAVNFDFGYYAMADKGYSTASFIAASMQDLGSGVVRGIWSGDMPGTMYNYVTISGAGSWGPMSDPLLICNQANVFSEDPVMSYMAMLAGSGMPADYAMAILQNDPGNVHFDSLNQFYAMNGQMTIDPFEFGPAPWKTSCAEKLGGGFYGMQQQEDYDVLALAQAMNYQNSVMGAPVNAQPIGTGVTPGYLGLGASGLDPNSQYSGPSLNNIMQSAPAAVQVHSPEEVNSNGRQYGSMNGSSQILNMLATPAGSDHVAQAFVGMDGTLHVSGGWNPGQTVNIYSVGSSGQGQSLVGTATADNAGWVSYITNPGFLGYVGFAGIDGSGAVYSAGRGVSWEGDALGARPQVNFDFSLEAMEAKGYNVASFIKAAQEELSTGVVRETWSGNIPASMYNYVTITATGSYGPMSDPLLICNQANVFSDDPVMSYMAMLAGSGMPADYAFAIMQNDPENEHFDALNRFYSYNNILALNPYDYGPPPWQTTCAEKLGTGFYQ